MGDDKIITLSNDEHQQSSWTTKVHEYQILNFNSNKTHEQ